MCGFIKGTRLLCAVSFRGQSTVCGFIKGTVYCCSAGFTKEISLLCVWVY